MEQLAIYYTETILMDLIVQSIVHPFHVQETLPQYS